MNNNKRNINRISNLNNRTKNHNINRINNNTKLNRYQLQLNLFKIIKTSLLIPNN